MGPDWYIEEMERLESQGDFETDPLDSYRDRIERQIDADECIEQESGDE